MKDFLTTTQTHPPQIPLPYYLLMLLAMVLLSYLSWLGITIMYGVGPLSLFKPFNSLPFTPGTSGKAFLFLLVCPFTIAVWPCLLFSS